jgi:hypothetical protein
LVSHSLAKETPSPRSIEILIPFEHTRGRSLPLPLGTFDPKAQSV